MNTEQYFAHLNEEVEKCFAVANKARAKGIDPVSEVEVPVATTLAEKAVGLISMMYPQLLDSGIVERIFELEEEYGQLDTTVSFKIAEEIAREKFCKFEDLLQAIDAGIRVGFSYVTLGVVSSPLEGFTELKLGKTKDGKEYFIANFSGPIRSAGTTATCVVMMLIDFLRETFGYAKYDPTEEEVKRYVTENYDYHERVTNLQYLPTPEEITYLASRMPIQLAGEPTEQREVSNHKDLPRVETDFIRGGMCLAFSEGLAQKAQKGFRLLKSAKANGVKTTGWDFLEDFIKEFKEAKKGDKGNAESSTGVYMKDLVAGRPVYGHPSRSGSFRFRYGRTRSGGFSATSVHPATMQMTDGFLSYGSQLKLEKPTKGCVVSVCDQMDGPIVKLRDGSVRRVSDPEEAKKMYQDVEEILYLGDLLVPFGDVLNRNYDMLKPGFVEEWWGLELEAKLGSDRDMTKGPDTFAKPLKDSDGVIIDPWSVSFVDAVRLSKKHGVPLHPSYLFLWTQISWDQFLGLLDWLARGSITDKKLVLPWARDDRDRFVVGKRALEFLGVEQQVTLEHVVLSAGEVETFLYNLGLEVSEGPLEGKIDKVIGKVKDFETHGVLQAVDFLCEVEVKDKAGTFIGARMGKPDKAKLRKLQGSPHVLFPVAEEGGRLRSMQAAVDVGYVESDFPNFFCEKCQNDTVYPKCEDCGAPCKKLFVSRMTGERSAAPEDMEQGGPWLEHSRRRVDVRKYFNQAKKMAGVRLDDLPVAVKGVKGTSNAGHDCEHLAKGLLRAKYDLHVNKDGTIRYDMNEMAITHFTPKEIGTSVERVRELGYEEDTSGEKLEREDQILTLFPHDVILPGSKNAPDERADDVFFNIAQFVDDELEQLYGVDRFLNLKDKKDVVGQLVVNIAPHICTATVGRIIGFSQTQTMLASPYMHAAMRRDCDGDEAASMLLMDMLLNFSRKFLPAHRGGTQDAPLVLNTQIRAGDVDDQILDFEVSGYPLSLYRDAEKGVHSSEIKGVEFVKDRLKNDQDPFVNVVFTHACSDIGCGVNLSSYKTLPTMAEKVAKMMALVRKLRGVDTSDVARLMIERHFIRDIRGNLRKFSQQQFRCVSCNNKYRRPPLSGHCSCGGRLIFTIAEGSVLKYMQPALDLAREHAVSPYLLECLELTEMYIHSVFGKDPEKQETIDKWF